MLGHGKMLLYLVHLLRIKIEWRVFCAIHHARLQGLRHLRKRHYLRIGTERAHLLIDYFRSLYAHFQAAHVGRDMNWPIGRHHLKTAIPEGQTSNALGFQNAEQPLPNRPVHYAP